MCGYSMVNSAVLRLSLLFLFEIESSHPSEGAG